MLAAGIDIAPADLDVVSSLNADNLQRLASVLADLDAFPQPVPGWEHGLNVGEVQRWRPFPPDEDNLNHCFVTKHGLLGVVPRLTGTYEVLANTARWVSLGGQSVRAVEFSSILERLRTSARAKDEARWQLAKDFIRGQGQF